MRRCPSSRVSASPAAALRPPLQSSGRRGELLAEVDVDHGQAGAIGRLLDQRQRRAVQPQRLVVMVQIALDAGERVVGARQRGRRRRAS